MKDLFSIFGFLGIILLFAYIAGGSMNFDIREEANEDSMAPKNNETAYIESTATNVFQEQLTPQEIEYRVAELYTQLNELKRLEREKMLWGTPSPYRDYIELRIGDVWSTDPNTEYLVLRMKDLQRSPLSISDWYLESYVTKKRAGIPQGDRILERWRAPQFDDITLMPGEEALLITSHSPIRTSFRENTCTGYLNQVADFFPFLSNRCTSPSTELTSSKLVRLDDDACYTFITQLNSCTTPNEDDVPRGRCTLFVENTFNYNSCIINHKNKPFFTRDGYWYIYLQQNNELWRNEREIIRLLDEYDRVVAVLEY